MSLYLPAQNFIILQMLFAAPARAVPPGAILDVKRDEGR
jgi:hypothetical protein